MSKIREISLDDQIAQSAPAKLRRCPKDLAKKAFRCGHTGIHHAVRTASGITKPCNHPGCKCKDYNPAKK